ncbi:hypothetical protein [Bordetella genomosp. 9]|uniref:hypothetical protein n=1 Tax=Bordetella genomosp. 9 TaxID=1416803 RepID=UPI0015C61708|nr:hypothetical protein [Bordetella genomosp. 9]
MKKMREQQERKHPAVLTVLHIVTAVVLALAPWAASSVQAADQRSSSGSSRPLMPGNQPAGTGLDQPVPGSTMGPNAQRPGTPAPAAGTGAPPMTKVPSGAPSSSMPGQGTVSGSKGAPGSIGDPAGGTAGSRGAKDNQLGR